MGTSEGARKRWEDPEYRAAHKEKMRALAADPEYRKKLSAASKARWAKPGAKEEAQIWRSDPVKQQRHLDSLRTPEARQRASEQMKAQWATLTPEERRQKTAGMRKQFKGGFRLTKIEATVADAVAELGGWYRLHSQIDGYTADILVQPDLVIECDGAWFHDQRKNTDALRDVRLTELGYRTLRLSEAEINDGTFVTKLREALDTA